MQHRIEFKTTVEGIALDCVIESNQSEVWLEEVNLNGVDVYPLLSEQLQDSILEDQLKKMSKDSQEAA